MLMLAHTWPFWYDLQASILRFTFSFPRISIIIGTPTPDSKPAIAYLKIRITIFDDRFSSFPIWFIAPAILAASHSCIPSIFSWAFRRTPSSNDKLTIERDHTNYLGRMAFSEFRQFYEGVVGFCEEVRPRSVDILQSVHSLLRHSQHSCEIILRWYFSNTISGFSCVEYDGVK
jgi:hypothetical protein